MSTADGGRPRRADLGSIFDRLQAAEPERAKLLVNGLGMRLALIPGNAFTMGSPAEETGRRENEGPQHTVVFQQPFYVGVCPVSQAQYEQVTGANPSRFTRDAGGGPEHPAERVSWDDAVAFCKRLSDLPEEQDAGRVYRLPTEAEWEYACRGGTTSVFAHGAGLGSAQANFDGAFPYGRAPAGPALGRTTRVGSYPANNFGLHDMHGNVWEWCADWYDERAYAYSSMHDPKGPKEGRFRVVRGGCWRSHAATCRAAYRNALVPNNRDPYTGFRVVAVVGRGA